MKNSIPACCCPVSVCCCCMQFWGFRCLAATILCFQGILHKQSRDFNCQTTRVRIVHSCANEPRYKRPGITEGIPPPLYFV